MCLSISYFNFLTEEEAIIVSLFYFSCCKHVVISTCSACSYRLQYSFISLPVLKIIAYITCTIDFQQWILEHSHWVHPEAQLSAQWALAFDWLTYLDPMKYARYKSSLSLVSGCASGPIVTICSAGLLILKLIIRWLSVITDAFQLTQCS